MIVSQKRKYWSGLDRANLKQGVIAENKRLLFEKFLREGNNQAIESLNNAPDVEMMLNIKGLDWKRISQRYVGCKTQSWQWYANSFDETIQTHETDAYRYTLNRLIIVHRQSVSFNGRVMIIQESTRTTGLRLNLRSSTTLSSNIRDAIGFRLRWISTRTGLVLSASKNIKAK